jgi:hypothetical protein
MQTLCTIWGSHSAGHEEFYFWDITRCSPFKVKSCFGGTRRLHLRGRRVSQARNQREACSKHNSLHGVMYLKIELLDISTFSTFLNISLSFLLLPLWSIGHPWNALFHFSFLILGQTVGLPGRGTSPLQRRYLHKHRINANIHALSGIRTHDPSTWADEDSFFLNNCLKYLSASQ